MSMGRPEDLSRDVVASFVIRVVPWVTSEDRRRVLEAVELEYHTLDSEDPEALDAFLRRVTLRAFSPEEAVCGSAS